MRWLPLVALAGCTSPFGPKDGAQVPYSDTGGDADTGGGADTGGPPTADASFSVLLQRPAWGTVVSRCALEVAFYEPAVGDGTGRSRGQTMTIPTDPGTCAYTAFTGPQAAGPDNIRGTIDAGRALYLASREGTLTLDRTVTDDTDRTLVTYTLPDCEADFPFGRAFDLVGEGSPDGLAPFTLPGAVAVGPDLVRTVPADADLVDEALTHSLQDPLSLAWSLPEAAPTTSAGVVVPTFVVSIRNNTVVDNQMFEALACLPGTDGGIVISTEDLAQLTPEDGAHETAAVVQVDAVWEGGEVAAPWGQIVKVRSAMSFSGNLHLTE